MMTQALRLTLVGLLTVSVGLYLVLLGCFLAARRWFLWLHEPSDEGHRVGPDAVGVTVLKPCAGADDDLEACLESYCHQDYPNLQILLGVRTVDDPAYPALRAVADRHPELDIEVVLTDGGSFLSPKIGSVEVMLGRARHELLWVSDSNTLVHPDTLGRLVEELEQEGVGIVVSPVVGVGERSVGASLDNLTVNSYSWLGTNGIYVVLGRVATLGKSLLVRRADLEAVGLEAMGRSFGDDEVLVSGVVARGQKAIFGRRAVGSVTRDATMRKTLGRHLRWLQIRWSIAPLASCLYEAIMSPIIPALALFAVFPSDRHGQVLVAAMALQLVGDLAVFWRMRGELLPTRHLPLVLLRPLVALGLWARAAVDRRVHWRGATYEMGPGATIVPLGPEPAPEPESARASS